MDPSTLIDLAHTLGDNTQTYPGDPGVEVRPVATVAKDGCSVHSLNLGSHSGTHIDAPSHFFESGKTIDLIPLSSFIGTPLVVDLTTKGLQERQKILWDDIKSYSEEMKKGVFLILYTGWSDHWGTPKYYNHPYLSKDAADKILERGIRVLGVDMLNPDETLYQEVGGSEGFAVHLAILSAGGIIAENLTNLKNLRDQNRIAFIPLKIAGCDGSPVRAFAWKES